MNNHYLGKEFRNWSVFLKFYERIKVKRDTTACPEDLKQFGLTGHEGLEGFNSYRNTEKENMLKNYISWVINNLIITSSIITDK